MNYDITNLFDDLKSITFPLQKDDSCILIDDSKVGALCKRGSAVILRLNTRSLIRFKNTFEQDDFFDSSNFDAVDFNSSKSDLLGVLIQVLVYIYK